jgi:hypothetical protein
MARARGFGVVKAVHHAHAFDGLLLHAIHLHRLGKVRCLQDGGGDVDDMMELRAYSTCVLDAVRPRYNQRLRVPQVRSHLLTLLERCVHEPMPDRRGCGSRPWRCLTRRCAGPETMRLPGRLRV